MNFNKHYNFEGKHAFMSASSPYWLNYSPEKLRERYFNSRAAEQGTIMHAFAADCIKLSQRLPRSKKTINMYVNDAIGFGLIPEQPLAYSKRAFGTADAIGIHKDVLRIHDLKTGAIPGKIEQLMIYDAEV